MSLLSISFLYAIGCSASMQDAPSNAEVNFTPEEYEFSWTSEDNAVDRAGRLFAFDIVVTDANNRFGPMPLPNTKVEIISLHDGAYLIPQEAIELVSYPGLPGDVQSIQDVREQCTDEFGNYSFGIKEHIIFPEINFDKVDRIRGMDITLVTNGKNKKVAFALLQAMNFPFNKKKDAN